jgi:hypothetical protein
VALTEPRQPTAPRTNAHALFVITRGSHYIVRYGLGALHFDLRRRAPLLSPRNCPHSEHTSVVLGRECEYSRPVRVFTRVRAWHSAHTTLCESITSPGSQTERPIRATERASYLNSPLPNARHSTEADNCPTRRRHLPQRPCSPQSVADQRRNPGDRSRLSRQPVGRAPFVAVRLGRPAPSGWSCSQCRWRSGTP